MSMTLEMVAARVAILEKQMADLMSEEKPKKETKKEKKEAKVKTDEPKKKRGVSGYLVFAKEMRETAKEKLTKAGNEGAKPTEVLTEVAKMWRDLDEEGKEEWNNKAKTLNAGSSSGSEDEEAKEEVEEKPKKEKKEKKGKKDEE